MRRRALLSGLVSAGLAGCLRLDESGTTPSGTPTTGTAPSSPGASTPTAAGTTPNPTAEEPTEPAATSTPNYPVGLSETGVDRLLVQSMERALVGASFHTEWTKLDRTNDEFRWQKAYDVEAGTALGAWTRVYGGPVDIYRAADGAPWRESLGGEYTYGTDPDGFSFDEVLWGIELEPFLDAADWGPPTLVEAGDPPIWEVTADAVADETALPGYHDSGTVVSIDAATLRVDGNSVVRSLSADYRIQIPGEEIAYESRFDLGSLGSVTVTEPDWTSTARERTPVVSAALTDDDRFIELVIESGNRLEAGSDIAVFDVEGTPEDRFRFNLREPLEPGVTAYVWKTAEFPTLPNGAISRGGHPSDASPIELPSRYRLVARRRTSEYFAPVDVRG